MGNRVYIEVVTETPQRGGEAWEVVKVSDDFVSTSIALVEGKAPEDDKELFFFALESGSDEAHETITFAYENEKPLHINDVFYEFKEWEPWWKEARLRIAP